MDLESSYSDRLSRPCGLRSRCRLGYSTISKKCGASKNPTNVSFYTLITSTTSTSISIHTVPTTSLSISTRWKTSIHNQTETVIQLTGTSIVTLTVISTVTAARKMETRVVTESRKCSKLEYGQGYTKEQGRREMFAG